MRQLVARIGLVEHRPPAHRKIDRVEATGPRNLRVAAFLVGQFKIKPPRQSTCNDVLQLHRSRPVAVEIGPTISRRRSGYQSAGH